MSPSTASDTSSCHAAAVLGAELPPRWLTPEQFERLVAEHRFHEHLRARGVIAFSFPERAALPAGLGLWLLSFLNQLAAIGKGRIRLDFATPDGLFGYLDRNGFLQLLDDRIETVPERPLVSGADLRRGQTQGLVEIVPLVPGTTGASKRAILNRLVDGLIDFYPAGEQTQRLRSHVFTVLGELVDNVFSHSRTPIPGYASLQAYDKRRRPRVQVAVSDSGLGIPASIRGALGQRLRNKSDADLIIQAFRDGLSRHGTSSGRGCGLPKCARLAADYSSTLYVRTPSAQVILHPANATRLHHEAEVRTPEGPLDGTHICLEFLVA